MEQDINYTLFGYVIESKFTLILLIFGVAIGMIVLIAGLSILYVRKNLR